MKHLSKYTRRLDRNGYTVLFNGLTLKKAYAKTSVMDSILKGEQPSTILIKNGFLTTLEQDKQRFSELKSKIGEINIANIVMLVDNRCNFACKYCQIEENMNQEQKSYSMSLATAKKALDLFEKNSQGRSKRTVNITGGEPLMNFDTVKYIIDRTQDMPNTRTVIFTNGSLITPEQAEYFARTGTLMLVSLDGPKDIHDSVRIRHGGGGTFYASLHSYELLKRAGCKTGISSVTGAHNVDRIDEVSELFLQLEPPSIGLNFGHYLLGKENPAQIPMEKFADLLTRVYQTMREKNIFVENISRFITPFCQEEPRLNECQAQGRGFTVDSRGKVGVCKSLLVSDLISKPIGEVQEDISREHVFKEWAERSPFTLEECINCNVIGICGGGCTYDSYAVNDGDITKIDPKLCDFTKKILEFLIWDLFEDTKEKVIEGVYIPTVEEQEIKFLKYYDPTSQLQRSVGHEKDR